MDDKQLLAQFAAAALTGFIADGAYRSGMYSSEGASRVIIGIAEAMVTEFKQRTEQKGNGND